MTDANLDEIRAEWRGKPATEGANQFDRRLSAILECSVSAVQRSRTKLRLVTPKRQTRAHVLRERSEK